MPVQPPYVISQDGLLFDRAGTCVTLPSVQDTDVEVSHLVPFVFSVDLPKGESTKVVVEFASHCWTDSFDAAKHAGQMVVHDHRRPRVFAPQRYELSVGLPRMIRELAAHTCYLTPQKRNFMAFDGRLKLPSGEDYRVFFTMRGQKGRWDGVRYRLRMFVESAYPTSDPVVGMEVSFVNIVSKTLRNEKIRYNP